MAKISLPSTSSGLGVAVTRLQAAGQPPNVLADYIDPETGDYLSLVYTYDPVDAMVINALKTVRGSGSAVTSIGARFRDIKKITSSIRTRITTEIETALAVLIKRRDIKVDGYDFEVLKEQQAVQVTFKWKNLRSFDDKQRSVFAILP